MPLTKVNALLLDGIIAVDDSGKVQINGATGTYDLNIYDPTDAFMGLKSGTKLVYIIGQDSNGDCYVLNSHNATLRMGANNVEYLRIDPVTPSVLVRNSAALGYATSSGGTVTQATSKSTAVTLNKPCGQITMNGAALAANTTVVFALNNSSIAVGDVVAVNISFGAGDNYLAWCFSVGAGTCSIALRNISAGSRSEAVVLNFAVIKGATS